MVIRKSSEMGIFNGTISSKVGITLTASFFFADVHEQCLFSITIDSLVCMSLISLKNVNNTGIANFSVILVHNIFNLKFRFLIISSNMVYC